MKVSKIKEFELLYGRADKAGLEAVAALKVAPMVVQQHANVLNDNSPVVKEWVVDGGPCGFASINIKPANSGFAKYLVEAKIARKNSYSGGISIYVFQFGQSLARKEEYAFAFARILQDAGIKAYAESRID